MNAQLEAMTAGAAVRHEAFVTVVVREDVINKDAKRAGRGVLGRARILYSVLAETEAHGKSDFVLETEVSDEQGTVVARTRGVYQLRRF